MRYIILILILGLLNCQGKKDISTKSEEGIDPSVFEMWNNFVESNPRFKNEEQPESWYFHNNKADADRLANLTLSGKKKAVSSLFLGYEEANIDLPKVGTMYIITDFAGEARAIVEVIKVDIIPFNKITDEYAEMDLGSENQALEKWKKAHWDYFEKKTVESGKEASDEMLVVCEMFETVWK